MTTLPPGSKILEGGLIYHRFALPLYWNLRHNDRVYIRTISSYVY